MTKKTLRTFAIILAALMLSACGNADTQRTASATTAKTVSDLIEQTASTEEPVVSEEPATSEVVVSAEESEPLSETPENPSDVDLDLTVLSKTMVYSEVYNIMVSPEDYLGKSIRMNGIYNTFIDDATGIRYFYCIIQDATACCAQGIEFELTDDYSFPADYPESGDTVTVVGNFDTYMEGEYMYCTLRDAVLEKSN